MNIGFGYSYFTDVRNNVYTVERNPTTGSITKSLAKIPLVLKDARIKNHDLDFISSQDLTINTKSGLSFGIIFTGFIGLSDLIDLIGEFDEPINSFGFDISFQVLKRF